MTGEVRNTEQMNRRIENLEIVGRRKKSQETDEKPKQKHRNAWEKRALSLYAVQKVFSGKLPGKFAKPKIRNLSGNMKKTFENLKFFSNFLKENIFFFLLRIY